MRECVCVCECVFVRERNVVLTSVLEASALYLCVRFEESVCVLG